MSEEASVEVAPTGEPLHLPDGSVPNQEQDDFGPTDAQRQRESQSRERLSPISGKSPTSKQRDAQDQASKQRDAQEAEHHQWSMEHWVRMDRDHDGYITRGELDSEVFRKALRSCLGAARKTVNGQSMGSEYSRTKLNIDQAIDFVRRKADNNADSSITFEEFESFTRSIRYGNSKCNADLIFALFDLDGDGAIDELEFREIYRYFLGRMPLEKDFKEEWMKLDMYGMQQVSKAVYIRWLQTSTNPIFKRHAPPTNVPSAKDTQDMSPYTKTSNMFPNDDMVTPKALRPHDVRTPDQPRRRRTPVLKKEADQVQLQEFLDAKYGGGFLEKMDRPEWNRRHHLGSWDNEGKPVDLRSYFSRPQSLPELTRFYSTHRGFEKHGNRMKLPEPRRKTKILSQDTKENPIAERDRNDGTMYCSRSGQIELWKEKWQDPAWKKCRYSPGSLWLRLPGDPESLYLDV